MAKEISNKTRIRRLTELRERVLLEPHRYDQTHWAGKDSACGFTCCLAGTACLMAGYHFVAFDSEGETGVAKKGNDRDTISEIAEQYLGLDWITAKRRFSGNTTNWTADAYEAFHKAKTPQQKAYAAAMQLDYLIEEYSKSSPASR